MTRSSVDRRLRLLAHAFSLALVVACFTVGGAAAWSERRAPSEVRFRPWITAPEVPADRQYHYSLAARVRPLAFWITRKGVGMGRIVRADAGGGEQYYELLVGSDPARAPRRINRWGSVSEIHHPAGVEIVGVMTEADEQTVDAAKRSLEEGRHVFKAIRASVGELEARAQVIRVSLAEDLTLRDLDELLGRLPEEEDATARVVLPNGVEPGFLGAVARIVAESSGASRAAGGRRASAGTYVWDRGLYDLSAKWQRVGQSDDLQAACTRCLETQFRIHNRATGKRSAFRLTYATEGPLSGIPLRIVYRPRWWFEAELVLEEAR